jgi:hypothetical protein
MDPTRYGPGGWVSIDNRELPGKLYLRLGQDEDRHWDAFEFYLAGRQRLTPGLLRRLPLGRLVATATQGPGGDILRALMDKQGPPLQTLADSMKVHHLRPENCENCGGLVDPVRHQGLSWVEAAWWAQDAAVQSPPMSRRPGWRTTPEPAPSPPLKPPLGKLTDDYLQQVSASYDTAVRGGSKAPAVDLAQQAGVSRRTVHRWIYTARKRGVMAPGRQGRVG